MFNCRTLSLVFSLALLLLIGSRFCRHCGWYASHKHLTSSHRLYYLFRSFWLRRIVFKREFNIIPKVLSAFSLMVHKSYGTFHMIYNKIVYGRSIFLCFFFGLNAQCLVCDTPWTFTTHLRSVTLHNYPWCMYSCLYVCFTVALVDFSSYCATTYSSTRLALCSLSGLSRLIFVSNICVPINNRL